MVRGDGRTGPWGMADRTEERLAASRKRHEARIHSRTTLVRSRKVPVRIAASATRELEPPYPTLAPADHDYESGLSSTVGLLFF
jgi:hypothetical protein